MTFALIHLLYGPQRARISGGSAVVVPATAPSSVLPRRSVFQATAGIENRSRRNIRRATILHQVAVSPIIVTPSVSSMSPSSDVRSGLIYSNTTPPSGTVHPNVTLMWCNIVKSSFTNHFIHRPTLIVETTEHRQHLHFTSFTVNHLRAVP